MSDQESGNIFQFSPFKSFVSPSFWHKLTEIKIDIDRLSDCARKIHGFYINDNALDCLLEVDCTAFNGEFSLQKNAFYSNGVIYNKNTIEDFKNCNKTELLIEEGRRIWENIENGNCLLDPSLLSNFVVLSFANLKIHSYYYWFAYPAPIEPVVYSKNDPKSLADVFSSEQVNSVTGQYFSMISQKDRSFFILEENENGFEIKRLQDKISHVKKDENFKNEDLSKFYFCFSDPCEFQNSGWVLRMYLACLVQLCPNLRSKTIKILSIRIKNSVSLEKSVFFEVILPSSGLNPNEMKWVGWEQNEKGKLLPKVANMADSMDPEKLAESSINLNLKLMKWRLLPNLNLDIIANQKCLLIGAGTLGCGVARSLLSWGVNQITLVDGGNVSYSNPIRQSLYTHADALNGGKKKALAAAANIKTIHPGCVTKGYDLHIPMPGHPVGESMMAKTLENLKIIEDLVSSHDVLFLLTDSRESRWLPTLLGAHFNKIVINSALGFDSYLVMRHGTRKENTEEQTLLNDESSSGSNLKCIPGDKLGCYFCNDITAPGNSMKDRTLDQQCTVTRPAVSNIASSLAVEILVALLQHPCKEFAPAYIAMSGNQNITIPEGILGILPHSIRGMLSSFEQILPATEKFNQCIACSEKVLAEYKSRGNEFLFEVFDSAKYLEDLTGISDLLDVDNDIIDFNDSDFELSE